MSVTTKDKIKQQDWEHAARWHSLYCQWYPSIVSAELKQRYEEKIKGFEEKYPILKKDRPNMNIKFAGE